MVCWVNLILRMLKVKVEKMECVRLLRYARIVSMAVSPIRSSLERSNPRNLIARMDYCGCPSLRPRQHNIDEVVGRWHRGHIFEVVDGHGKILRIADIALMSGLH